MKYKLINKEITENYAEELLKCRGIVNFNQYLNPPISYIQEPNKLDNIAAGAEVFLNTIKENGRIMLIVDCDVDGFTSSAIMHTYIKRLNPEIEIDYRLHEGKQHGLQDHIDFLEENLENYALVILPDSSSNDYNYHERLKGGPKCLVLDHHLSDPPFSDNAIIINNHLSADYINKDLTGAGVVYQFCKYIDQIKEYNYSEDLLDLAAVGIVGDMGSVLSLENRYFITNGLSNIKNIFLKTIIDKQSFSMEGKVNPMTVAFYVVPMINAMIRVGTMAEKTRLFEAFVDGDKLVPSQKRGAKGEQVPAAMESVRECTNARTRQNSTKESIVDSLEIKIHKLGLLENKILFVRLDDDDVFPPELNGLVAMQLSQKFKKPTIVARVGIDGYVKGSARGLNDSPLVSMKDFLDESGYFEYAQGHDNAFGISILNSKVESFLEYSNEKLKDVDFGEDVHDVHFVREGTDPTMTELVLNLGEYESIWGQGNDTPKIFIDKLFIDKNSIDVMGRYKDTLKFTINGVSYIKFHAKELIREIEESPYPRIEIKIIGKAKINEWGGRITPNVFIESYEIRNADLSF